MGAMIAYPGRTFGQLYHLCFRINDLHDGELELSRGRNFRLADVGSRLGRRRRGRRLAAAPAVNHVGSLLTGSPDVRLESAPGGDLGVLTGRSAVQTTW